MAHGYPRRARLVDDFVSQTFLIYVLCMVIWGFIGARYEANVCLTKMYRRVTSTGSKQLAFTPILTILGFGFVGGFLLINNLTFIDWTGHHARDAV